MNSKKTLDKPKRVTAKTLDTWELEIKENFNFEIKDGTVVKAVCKICSENYKKIVASYKGKVVEDVQKYGEHGTIHVMKSNLTRHMQSAAHTKCVEISTGKPASKKQMTLACAFGTAKEMALNALKPLLAATLYLMRKEKPFQQFPELLELNADMGMKLTSSFNNEKAAKVFAHILSQQLVARVRENVRKANFLSWLIDGSSAAKRRLTYEAELIYIRTANNLQPTVELLSFVSMQPYAVVNSQTLTHALIKELTLLADKTAGKDVTPDTPLDNLVSDLKKTGIHMKVVAAGADGAAINFGVKKGLLQSYRMCASEWLLGVHCLSHRLELAAADGLSLFSDVDEFLREMYLHFRNSPKEWSLVTQLAKKQNVALLSQPKSYGTRFLPHVKGALTALRYNWAIYAEHFSDCKEQNQDKQLAAKASCWIDKLCDFKFLAKCCVYEDIITHLSTTARLFQAEDARSIADASRAYHTVKAEQDILLHQPGSVEYSLWHQAGKGTQVEQTDVPHVRATTRSSRSDSCAVKMKLLVKQLRDGQPGPDGPSKSKFIDREANEAIIMRTGSGLEGEMKESVASVRRQAIECLKDALADRFEEFESTDSQVLSKVAFLDISTWPNEIEALYSFGVDDITALMQHFATPLNHAGMTEVDALHEFKEFKMEYGPKMQTIGKTAREFWQWVYQVDSNMSKYRNFFLIVELLLVIPFSTAVVERGFSAVRRILTDWRCSLSTALVSDCIQFCTRKPELENQSFRAELIETAARSFLDGAEKENDNLGTLTNRRINKILSGIERDRENDKPDLYTIKSDTSSGEESDKDGSGSDIEL